MAKVNPNLTNGSSGGERDTGNRGNVFDLPKVSAQPLIDPEIGKRISALITQLESTSSTIEAAGIQAEITRLAGFASRPPVIKFDLPDKKDKPTG